MQSALEKVYGVISAVSGYTGDSTWNPTYATCAQAGHAEAVRVSFDPSRASYADLLKAFWRHTDPTDDGGQFVDRGPQYRAVIYSAVPEPVRGQSPGGNLRRRGIG